MRNYKRLQYMTKKVERLLPKRISYKTKKITAVVLAVILLLCGYKGLQNNDLNRISLNNAMNSILSDVKEVNLEKIPEFEGEPYAIVNNNKPSFSEKEKRSTEIVEIYPELDYLGRCGTTFANLHVTNMPTEDRESIGMIKPSGWKTKRYEFVDGKYLYNRCHLIGFQLAGENANPKNLITGTRYMNVEGMLPFENMVADYLRKTNNHVLYRVTSIFYGNELVARGVQMEAYSVEDNGKGIQFNVYCFNNQPGVEIDYATGNNHKDVRYNK